MNSTGIKLAVGAPWPFAFYKQNQNLGEREKATREESIALKYSKAKRSILNATKSPLWMK
jgi:hypothetical protein